MNDDDRRILDAWHQVANKSQTIEGTVVPMPPVHVHRPALRELLALVERNLADAPTLVETGHQWCRTHRVLHGVPGRSCDLRPLVYVERAS